MYQKIIFILLLLMTQSLYAGLFGDDEKVILLPTHEVFIEGEEVFSKADILDAISAEHKSFFEFWKDDKAIIKDKLIPSLHLALRSYFDSEGYYDAKFNVEERKESILITIEEKDPIRVNDINITSDFEIEPFIMIEKGEIFKAKKFIASKGNIVKGLLNEGYCSYDLDSKAYVDLEKHIVNLQYHLQKGGICTFGNVTVTGLETIDPEIVKSRVRAQEGERFNTELVQDTSTAIYGLQSFDSVLIGVDRKFYNVVPVDIHVKEMKDPYHVEVGAGFDTYVGPRVNGELIKYNFMGNAQKLGFRALWSKREQLAIVDFYKPVLFELYDFDVDFGSSGGLSSLDFDAFHETKVFIKAFMKHESERFKLMTGMAFEVIEISKLEDNVTLLRDEDAYNTFLLAYPYLDIVYDGRDSKLNPKFGYYLAAYVEMGVPTDDVSSLYLKTELEARGIYTVADLTMAAVGKIGSIDMQDPDIGIPESKKFFGGGAYSNRAYGFRELGEITSPTTYLPYAALSMANLSLELDYPVWGDLYGAVFNDNTMLTNASYDYTGEIISSAGVGVRYMTPVGPFKIDLGMNISDYKQYGISFQIGQSF